MIVEIENKIVDWVGAAGLGVRNADVKKGKSIQYPAAFVTTEAGNFTPQGQVNFRCDLKIFLSIGFRDVSSERDRRKGLYPILEGVIQGLMGNDLGLAIKPLAPVKFNNVTDKELMAAGVTAFRLEFATTFTFKPTAEDGAELLRIGLDYFLQDPADDGKADATDEITLKEG